MTIDYASYPSSTFENCTAAPVKPRVVVHMDEHGNFSILSDRGEVEVLTIDEACPRDRVYLYTSHAKPSGFIDDLIGNDRIGQLGDMPGTEDAIRAHMEGKPAPKPDFKLVD
jgi:hypothetical protein